LDVSLLAGRTRTLPLRASAAAIAALAIAAPGASAVDATAPPSITVVGHASRKASNDTARLHLSVVSQGPTALQALNRNSSVARNVVNAVKAQGIPAADIRTETVSLNRVRVKRKHHPARVFYRAANRVVVTVRQIPLVAPVIDRAVAAGATGVSGLDFSTSKEDDLYLQALASAFDKAKAKAQLLANRAGVVLGAPLQIEEGSPLVTSDGFTNPLAATTGVPIQPGRATVGADVTVVFAIVAL
jgi:uncharacterized protein YggE